MLARAGGRYRLWADGRIVDASLRGRMKQDGSGSRVLVGDRVTVAEHGEGKGDAGATIEQVHPRRTVLRRRAPGGGRGMREVAANVDQVVVVGAARRPAWDPCLIDRFLAVAAANELPALIVINKTDLDPDAARHGDPYARAGYPVLVTSAVDRAGIEELHGRLSGRISLFAGPTGVGKSSLLNAIQPGLRLRTREVSRRSGGGRHTTVTAEMHPLPPDGFVVDTPGLRDIGVWGIEPMEVVAAFPEIARRQGECRFDDCRHLEEPACGVRAAVDEGEISSSRYNSYRTLLKEAEQAARPWA